MLLMTAYEMGKCFLNRTQKALISKERIGQLITLKLETLSKYYRKSKKPQYRAGKDICNTYS